MELYNLKPLHLHSRPVPHVWSLPERDTVVYPCAQYLDLPTLITYIGEYDLVQDVKALVKENSDETIPYEDFTFYIEYALDKRWVYEEDIHELLNYKFREDCSFHPVHNYYIALDESCAVDHGQLATLLLGTDLTYCLVDGRGAVAVATEGHDTAWGIVEGFIAMGQYPPLQYCDLPRNRNRGYTLRDQGIIKACNRSIQLSMMDQQRLIESNLSHLLRGGSND